MQFERGKSVKESLNIGLEPIFKEVQNELSEAIERYSITWWSYNSNLPPEDQSLSKVKWRNFPGSPGNNIHRMVGLVTSKEPQHFKENARRGKDSFKGIFASKSFKFTTINFYSTEKWHKKYGFEKIPNSFLVEIIYSINKK